jgi:hypothetical protein
MRQRSGSWQLRKASKAPNGVAAPNFLFCPIRTERHADLERPWKSCSMLKSRRCTVSSTEIQSTSSLAAAPASFRCGSCYPRRRSQRVAVVKSGPKKPLPFLCQRGIEETTFHVGKLVLLECCVRPVAHVQALSHRIEGKKHQLCVKDQTSTQAVEKLFHAEVAKMHSIKHRNPTVLRAGASRSQTPSPIDGGLYCDTALRNARV